MIECSWNEIKRIATAKQLTLQWVEIGENYHIALVDGPFHLTCLIPISDVEHEFVTGNYKSLGNKIVSQRTSSLTNPEDYRFRGQGTLFQECPPGQTNIDITPSATEDRWVDGGFLLTYNSNLGDSVSFNVVHPLVGVVETYVSSWLTMPGNNSSEILVYPAKIPAGLILRVIYTNIGATSAWCGCNYRLHKRNVV